MIASHTLLEVGQYVAVAAEQRGSNLAYEQLWFFLFVLLQLILACVYWRYFIKPTAERYLSQNTVVPEQLKGRWQYELFDCFSDLGTCCCFVFCHPCKVADLWYRSGWVHAVMGSNVTSCKAYYAGLCGNI